MQPSNNSALDIQAESLRLEAELEQLSINQARLNDEKAFLVTIDKFILKLIADENQDPSVDDPNFSKSVKFNNNTIISLIRYNIKIYRSITD